MFGFLYLILINFSFLIYHDIFIWTRTCLSENYIIIREFFSNFACKEIYRLFAFNRNFVYVFMKLPFGYIFLLFGNNQPVFFFIWFVNRYCFFIVTIVYCFYKKMSTKVMLNYCFHFLKLRIQNKIYKFSESELIIFTIL